MIVIILRLDFVQSGANDILFFLRHNSEYRSVWKILLLLFGLNLMYNVKNTLNKVSQQAHEL